MIMPICKSIKIAHRLKYAQRQQWVLVCDFFIYSFHLYVSPLALHDNILIVVKAHVISNKEEAYIRDLRLNDHFDACKVLFHLLYFGFKRNRRCMNARLSLE